MDQYLEFISNHYLLSLSLVVITYFLIQDFLESALTKHQPLSPMMAVTKMNSDKLLILDVREPHEFIKGHIENAMNISLGKLEEKLSSLEKYKNYELIVVCQSGTRATPACKTLFKAGFEKVYSITGGMQSWEENKFPIRVDSKNKD